MSFARLVEPSVWSKVMSSGGERDVGFFVSFDCTSDALQEIESFFKRSHKVIVALTVKEILDEQIAKKLA